MYSSILFLFTFIFIIIIITINTQGQQQIFNNFPSRTEGFQNQNFPPDPNYNNNQLTQGQSQFIDLFGNSQFSPRISHGSLDNIDWTQIDRRHEESEANLMISF